MNLRELIVVASSMRDPIVSGRVWVARKDLALARDTLATDIEARVRALPTSLPAIPALLGELAKINALLDTAEAYRHPVKGLRYPVHRKRDRAALGDSFEIE